VWGGKGEWGGPAESAIEKGYLNKKIDL